MRRSSRTTSEGPNDPDRSRPYRAKGPTLGKGKACELCRYRRVRCDGARPSCANCVVAFRDCVYIDYARPSASTGALSAKLKSLQRRYEELMHTSTSSSSTDLTMIEDRLLAGPTQLLNESLDDPWLEASLSKKTRETLLQIYVSECHRYAVTFVPKDQVEGFGLLDPPQRPHPCLLHAMLLAATDLGYRPQAQVSSTEDLSKEENDVFPPNLPSPERLLALTQSYCAQALANADRLQDYLQAELIVAFWYLRHGRVLEAQYGLAAVSRLAISCKLHRIEKEVIQEMEYGGLDQDRSWWDGSLLGRPKDEEELALRISLFWQSYYGDKTASLQTGVLSTYEDVEETYVTTIWPNIGQGKPSTLVQHGDYTSYSDVFDEPLFPSSETLPSPLTILVKAVILLDKAIRLCSLVTVDFDGVLKLELAVRRFESEILRKLLFQDTMTRMVRSDDVICFKALVQLLVIGAKIQLTHIDATNPKRLVDDNSASEQRLRRAHDTVEVVSRMTRQLEALEASGLLDGEPAASDFMGVTMGMLILTSRNIIANHVDYLEDQLIGEPEDTPSRAALQSQIDVESQGAATLSEAVHKIRSCFPFFESQWNIIKSGRASTYH